MASKRSPSDISVSAIEPVNNSQYKVIRSSNRKGPHTITCFGSDGTQAKWKEIGPVVDGTGAICYWKADDYLTEAVVVKWKKALGKLLARLLGLSEGADEDWRLTDFPKDYRLYRYIKGDREDVYLLGSKYVTKFRTANEFGPHLHWLCTHDHTISSRAHCKCRYCAGPRKQSLVNLSLGLTDEPGQSPDSLSDQKMISRNKRKAEEDIAKENVRRRNNSETAQRSGARTAPKAGNRKSLPAHVISSASNGPSSKKQTFQGPYVNKDRDRDLSELKCVFRAAEVVWCKLDKTFGGSKDDHPEVSIEYWPAVCEERVMTFLPQVVNESREENSAPIPQLKVSQNFQWKVRPLGTSDIFCKEESQLLPYLNYPVPLSFFQLRPEPEKLSHIHNGHGTDRPSISSFSSFSEAITAFSLALQMSVHIKQSWSLMDRYDIAFLKRLDAIGEQLSVEDLQITYEDSTLPWFQYLWWGAEKIWSGELIRLIVSAGDLPKGLREISPGSDARCFFLKITGIYRNEQESGMVKGPIFEMAPLNQREIDAESESPDFKEKHQPESIGRYIPDPPPGFFFRRLTPVGKEHHLVLQHIAGRYYPPHCLKYLPQLTGEEKPDPYSKEGRSLSLCGATEGKWLHMHCETWAADRKECFKRAETLAEHELIASRNIKHPGPLKTKSVLIKEPDVNDTSLVVTQELLKGSTGNPDNVAKGAEEGVGILGESRETSEMGQQSGLNPLGSSKDHLGSVTSQTALDNEPHPSIAVQETRTQQAAEEAPENSLGSRSTLTVSEAFKNELTTAKKGVAQIIPGDSSSLAPPGGQVTSKNSEDTDSTAEGSLLVRSKETTGEEVLSKDAPCNPGFKQTASSAPEKEENFQAISEAVNAREACETGPESKGVGPSSVQTSSKDTVSDLVGTQPSKDSEPKQVAPQVQGNNPVRLESSGVDPAIVLNSSNDGQTMTDKPGERQSSAQGTEGQSKDDRMDLDPPNAATVSVDDPAGEKETPGRTSLSDLRSGNDASTSLPSEGHQESGATDRMVVDDSNQVAMDESRVEDGRIIPEGDSGGLVDHDLKSESIVRVINSTNLNDLDPNLL